MITHSVEPPLATIALNDPAKRNALSLPMFEALDQALARIATDESTHVLLLHGEGPAFCSGFDLGAAVDDPDMPGGLILRLSALIQSLRRLPQVVVAGVQGAAIAGGCAILSACDFVVVAPEAVLGYPVHSLGISPAVTIPTLHRVLGDGAARSLLVSGSLINGVEAQRLGLATHTARSNASALDDARLHCRSLAQKGPQALRATKAWVNELDGSLRQDRFERPALDSAEASRSPQTLALLSKYWSSRRL
jgi:methylglutaconyl-CoA hydratase